MKKQILAAALLAVTSFGAFAADDSIAPKYTYAEVGFARTSIEFDANASAVDFDGYNVRGSYEFANDFHVFGGYQETDNNDFIDLKLKETQIGFGWHPKIDENADAILEVSYINQKAEAELFGFEGSDDADLYRVSAGFRAAFNKVVVGTIKANYTDGGDLGSEFAPSLGLEARINPMWSIVGEGEVSEGTKRFTLGVRASF